jgi:hypothetical protein
LPPPDIAHLRAALSQQQHDWRATLRSEPQIARLLLRKMIGPIELCDPPGLQRVCRVGSLVDASLVGRGASGRNRLGTPIMYLVSGRLKLAA